MPGPARWHDREQPRLGVAGAAAGLGLRRSRGRDARSDRRRRRVRGEHPRQRARRSSSRRFADQHEDRFDGVGYHVGPEGSILLDGALAHIECERFAHVSGRRPYHHRGPGRRRRAPTTAALCSTTAAATPRSGLSHGRALAQPDRRRAAGRSGGRSGGRGRVVAQHRPSQPLVRRRARRCASASPGRWRACRPARRSPCWTSAPGSATCRAPRAGGRRGAASGWSRLGLERSRVAAALAHGARRAHAPWAAPARCRSRDKRWTSCW